MIANTSCLWKEDAHRTYALSFVIAIVICLFYSGNAQAVPSFARQTGLACASCHVGSFGPQLTEFGRNFKLNGYTFGENGNYLTNFSAETTGTFEKLSKKYNQVTDGGNIPGAAVDRLGSNDNFNFDYVGLLYAGKLADHLGIMSQITYVDTYRTLYFDWSDLRYADTVTVAGQDLLYGFTVNNQPSLQDVWQTTPAWSFPYAGPYIPVVPTPAAGPYLANLGFRSVGAGAYVMWNDLVYAELSG